MIKSCRLFQKIIQPTLFVLLFAALGAVLVLKTNVLENGSASRDGLTGMVAVRGTVTAEELGLSGSEIGTINQVVERHAKTFRQVDLFVDRKSGSGDIQENTVLIFAMVLETDDQCEVRSWSRQIKRKELASQVAMYMSKAAREYEKFKKFPDVQENFKRLYI